MTTKMTRPRILLGLGVLSLFGIADAKYQLTSRQPSNVSLTETHWHKTGFGSIMEASFVIQNDNDFPVKDIEITCNHFAQSGTNIDSNTRTLYQSISAHHKLSVPNFSMGFIHSQVNNTHCKVSDFAQTPEAR